MREGKRPQANATEAARGTVAGGRSGDLVRRRLPFFVGIVARLLVVIFTPALSLWLPTTIGLITP